MRIAIPFFESKSYWKLLFESNFKMFESFNAFLIRSADPEIPGMLFKRQSMMPETWSRMFTSNCSKSNSWLCLATNFERFSPQTNHRFPQISIEIFFAFTTMLLLLLNSIKCSLSRKVSSRLLARFLERKKKRKEKSSIILLFFNFDRRRKNLATKSWFHPISHEKRKIN